MCLMYQEQLYHLSRAQRQCFSGGELIPKSNIARKWQGEPGFYLSGVPRSLEGTLQNPRGYVEAWPAAPG